MGGGYGRPFFMPSPKYPAVTIVTGSNRCPAVRALEDVKILATHAPPLPMPNCTMPDAAAAGSRSTWTGATTNRAAGSATARRAAPGTRAASGARPAGDATRTDRYFEVIDLSAVAVLRLPTASRALTA